MLVHRINISRHQNILVPFTRLYVNTREAGTHGNQPNVFLMGDDLNARKPKSF